MKKNAFLRRFLFLFSSTVQTLVSAVPMLGIALTMGYSNISAAKGSEMSAAEKGKRREVRPKRDSARARTPSAQKLSASPPTDAQSQPAIGDTVEILASGEGRGEQGIITKIEKDHIEVEVKRSQHGGAWETTKVIVPFREKGKPGFAIRPDGEPWDPVSAKEVAAAEAEAAAKLAAGTAILTKTADNGSNRCQEYAPMRDPNPSVDVVKDLGQITEDSSSSKVELRCRNVKEEDNMTKLGRIRVCATALEKTSDRIGTEIDGNFQGIKIDGTSRNWDIQFPGKARQDLAFQIENGPYVKDFLIFPRKFLPSIKSDSTGSKWDLKLPDGEKLLIDKASGKIVGGQDLAEPEDASSPLTYTGKGVMVQVVGREGLNLRGYPGSSLQTAKEAIITKGRATCKVKPDELWPNRKDPEGSPKFKFAKDDDFYDWLAKACPTLPK